MGKPAVVGVPDLTVDVAGGYVRFGARTVAEGALLTIDGTGGEVVAGSAPIAADAADPHLDRLLAWADEVSGAGPDGDAFDRLEAAHRVLNRGRAWRAG
jgi:pyruvate,orthophosphate dikinase